ncbi:MAG: hypothetical protein JSU61_00120 [Fidelibacterota bacterium]|nr:MAG: hypothetical protein JSU61_00120 [Candidatus Neomarinimicrobiota bacterium]
MDIKRLIAPVVIVTFIVASCAPPAAQEAPTPEPAVEEVTEPAVEEVAEPAMEEMAEPEPEAEEPAPEAEPEETP